MSGSRWRGEPYRPSEDEIAAALPGIDCSADIRALHSGVVNVPEGENFSVRLLAVLQRVWGFACQERPVALDDPVVLTDDDF